MARNLPAMVVNRQGEVWTQQGKVGMADSKQFLNSLGSEQSITTLTAILPTIIEQKQPRTSISILTTTTSLV